FYRHALEGTAVGESLRAARAQAHADGDRSPAWLGFALYGHPATLPPAAPGRQPRTNARPRVTVRVPLGVGPRPRRAWIAPLAGVAVLLFLALAARGLLARDAIKHVDVVLGGRVADETFQEAARDAVGGLRDALGRLGAERRAQLALAPPRRALCDGAST